MDYGIVPGAAASRSFPPAVAMHVVKIACERPDELGRSLSQWDGTEIAPQWGRDGLVSAIAAETVRQILLPHRLQPWRQKSWLSAQVPRDAALAAPVQGVCDLYTRPLRPDEVVLCVDEMTSLQPRPRKSPTKAAKKDRPTLVEHESGRDGAWNLLAAFDTRAGKVAGMTAARTRQSEFLTFLEQLEREIPGSVKTIHIVLDHLRMHPGKPVQAWLAKHPRLVFPHPPVPCSWMNRVEQWLGILRRQRLRIVDFPSKDQLAERLKAFIREWNAIAHQFNWTSKSVAKVMAKCQIEDAKSLTTAA